MRIDADLFVKDLIKCLKYNQAANLYHQECVLHIYLCPNRMTLVYLYIKKGRERERRERESERERERERESCSDGV